MKKSGRTAAGTQRWKCTICNASTTAATSAAPGPRSGPSRQEVADLELFVSRAAPAFSQARLCGGDDRALGAAPPGGGRCPSPRPAPRLATSTRFDGIWPHHDRVNRSGFDGGGHDGKDHCHGTEEVLVGAA